MLIEIKGVEFANLGAFMMLQSVISRLSRDIPGVQFALTPSSNCTFHQVASIGAFQRLRVGAMSHFFERAMLAAPIVFYRVANRYGVVLEKQVHTVLDASGFAYGTPWGVTRATQTALEIRRLRALGKRYIFLPQAFGSLSKESEWGVFGGALLDANLVYARDRESLDNINEVVRVSDGKFRISPDFTLGIIDLPDRSSPKRGGEFKIAIVPNSKLLSTYNSDELWRKNGGSFFEKMIRGLKRLNLRLLIVNSCRGEDDLLCNALAAVDPTAETISPGSPAELISALAGVDLVVSGRYHSCVSSLALGIPCIGVSWSHKYQPLFEDFGVPGFVVRRPDSEAVLEMVREVINEPGAVRSALLTHRGLVAQRVDLMWSEVVTTINS